MIEKAALLGAYALLLGAYASLFFSVWVLMIYVCSHFTCMLANPEPGLDWECAEQSTKETLTYYQVVLDSIVIDR